MENHLPRPVSANAARQQLEASRRVREASVRRATTPAGVILSVSFLCGALTLAPAHQHLGSGVTMIAVVCLVLELLILSARNQWVALRSMPRPRWSRFEVTLICVALLLGGVVGPHTLASRANSVALSWGLAAGVALAVAALLFCANASYRRRSF